MSANQFEKTRRNAEAVKRLEEIAETGKWFRQAAEQRAEGQNRAAALRVAT